MSLNLAFQMKYYCIITALEKAAYNLVRYKSRQRALSIYSNRGSHGNLGDKRLIKSALLDHT